MAADSLPKRSQRMKALLRETLCCGALAILFAGVAIFRPLFYHTTCLSLSASAAGACGRVRNGLIIHLPAN